MKQVYVAYAGLCGNEGGVDYYGLSCIVGPDGQDLARAGIDPAMLFADIDPSIISRGQKANPHLSDRPMELYGQSLRRQ